MGVTLLGAQAAEHEVRMLSRSDTAEMVFEPAYLRVQRGDTVVFRTAQGGGHHARSVLVPAGAAHWHTSHDVTTRITLKTEGVYLYVCDPHLPMGMVGVLQVGRATNAAAAREKALEIERGIVLNKGRLLSAVERVR